MRSPCKDCPDRKLGCHSICEKYIEYTKQNEEIRLKKARENNNYNDLLNMRIRRMRKK